MTDNESWNGGSKPFNGAEDGVPFEEGNAQALTVGTSASLDKLYAKDPDLKEYREERYSAYRENCVNPVLFESMLEEIANLDARLRYVNKNLDTESHENPHQTSSYARLVAERRKLFKTIDWSEGESEIGGHGFFDALEQED